MEQRNYIEINGRKQFLSICAKTDRLPILLYLHGGPGDAALPLFNKYNSSLENKFTVVVWEQRGAGKSYYPFADDTAPVIQTFIDDIHAIARYLLKHFDQEKLFLLGHSWGSVLGLRFIQQYPQLVRTYIGCGQVVDIREGIKLQYQFVRSKSSEFQDKKTTERLTGLDLSMTQEKWMDDLLFLTKQVVKYKGSLYGKSNYNTLVKDVILSRDYTAKELINRQKGTLQSIKYLWPELMAVNFWDVKSFEVPVVFMEGRYDYHVSSVIAKEYYDSITTKKQFHWFEKSCHFPQWSESDLFNQRISSLIE